tara:strand:+ start:369 stop:530 length:162 start_codon:yes stop_codon:yes gene_type:complete
MKPFWMLLVDSQEHTPVLSQQAIHEEARNGSLLGFGFHSDEGVIGQPLENYLG